MNAQLPQIQMFQQEEEAVETHLRDYYAAFKRGWWIILITFAIVVSLTVAYLSVKPEKYTATALVRISTGSGAGGLAATLGRLLPIGQSSSISTEVEMIKLRSVAEAVIRKLDIDKEEQNLGLDWEEIVSNFQSELKAKQRSTSDLVEIVANGATPEAARNIANAVAAEYIQLSRTSRQRLWEDLIEQMTIRLDQVRIELEESRKRLHDHEAEEGISTAFSPLLTGVGIFTGGYGTQYAVPEAPQAVAQLKAGIMQMEVELETLKKSFSDSDPDVIKLERQLAASKRRLQQETENAVEKYNKQFGLTRVAAEVVFNQQLYSSLVTKQEELKAQHIMQNKSSEMIQAAAKPLYPSKPNKKLISMMGATMGLFLGLGLAMFREYMDKSMHEIADVTESIDMPVLGAIPRLNKANIWSKGDENPEKKVRIDYEDSPQNRRSKELYIESYRMLQLELMAAANGRTEHSDANTQNQDGFALLMTSSVSGEDKSIVATNLAISIAQTGKTVLLVNADSHSSVHCELLDLNPRMGLMDVLMGNIELGDAIKKTSLDNLHVITAGNGNGQSDLPNLLLSSQLADFIESSKEQFDVTIFDSSPTMSTSGAAAIGSKVDGVALVIKAGKTQKDTVLQAKQRIQNAGGNILGAVLNHATVEKKYYR